MTRKIVGGEKDEHGIYQKFNPPTPPKPPQVTASGVTIDDELNNVLLATQRFLSQISKDIVAGDIKKDTAYNLKSCMDILMGLKKYQKDLLDDLSDEELERLADADKQENSSQS